jgi:hypothetical protein
MVAQVHPCRDSLIQQGHASKMVHRRIASLSGSFRFLREVAAELRLPIQVAKPAGQEFVGRDKAEPVEERRHFSAAKPRQLLGLPEGETAVPGPLDRPMQPRAFSPRFRRRSVPPPICRLTGGSVMGQ